MKDYKNMKGAPKGPKQAGKVMGHDGGVMKVKADNQKFDMGRVQRLGHESKGHMPKAFEYKY